MIVSAKNRQAFALVEAIVGLSIVALLASFTYVVMAVMNQNAVKARLMTLAEANARSVVDNFETISPYNPNITPPTIPSSLATGTTVSTIHLYVDPTDGTRNVMVTDATQTVAITNTNVDNVLALTVTVSYVYHGKTYQVQMNSLRASDT